MNVFEPVFVNLDGRNHGEIFSNIIVDVHDDRKSGSHKFGVVDIASEEGGIFGFYATVRIARAKTDLEKFRVE
jgi:hypothetical protein